MKFPPALLEDLARSGLDQRDAQAMKLLDIDASIMEENTGVRIPGYFIPYPPVFGREPFGRYRFLGSDEELIKLNVDPKRRYRQLPGTGCRLYFPPLLKGMRDWETVAKDIGIRLIFIEGEKKSYTVVARTGEYAIGIGGVSNWAPEKVEDVVIQRDGGIKPKKGKPTKPRIVRIELKEFKYIVWPGRIVIINFDWPDVVINNSVRLEREKFAAFLASLGADVRVIDLGTDLNSAKVGADDFLKANDAQAYVKLLNDAEPLARDGLSRMRARYTKIIIPANTYYDREARELISATDFYGSTKHLLTYDEEGKEQFASQAFDRDPVWATRLVFQPGEQPLGFVADRPVGGVRRAFNVWPGMPVPKQGDISALLEVFERLREINDPAACDAFECWCAWPLARPRECKMKLGIVLYSREQGTGKTLMAEILGKAYDPSTVTMVIASDLHSSFNYWAKHRQFIIANEATPSKSDAERLKSTVTETVVTVNTKNVHSYQIENRFNIIFTTNRMDSLAIDETDRRFVILQFPVLPPALIARLIRLRDDPETPGALLWHWQNRMSLSKFDPGMRAPMSEAKQTFIDTIKDEMTIFAEAIRDNPQEKLGSVYYRKAMTNEQMLAAYDDSIRPRTRAQGEAAKVRKALKEAGIPFVLCPADKGSPYKAHRLWFIDVEFCRSMKVRELNEWYCKQNDEKETNASARAKVLALRPARPDGKRDSRV